jgi:hypothetical protein
MRELILMGLLAMTVSAGAIAYAQVEEPAPPPASSVPDARSLASDQEVGEARRYYRAQCSRHQSAEFCDCVTAGVAQALMPQEVRIAARTISERINAQGDAAAQSDQDTSTEAMSSAERIEQVESHYANACAQFRR